ncbi:hypothetical protein MANES_01G213200v8 [Manihot esculenta]|uniref:Uncharacterized protein n=1 Tax=Manihot esculenta TaxID=3983 RepID=A0ACB7IEX8_MANES|nr:hypothetical protein MANES_01G213200v8 [Manihot esculenta]
MVLSNRHSDDSIPFLIVISVSQTNNGDKPARDWSELPHELIAIVADGLGIIDLLSFRGVCKDWNIASRTASAEIESSPSREPWFLLYGESSQCLLLSESGKKYTINIPKLNNGGATCIGSNNGWLLILQQNSIFFFCPFSDAKIDLPKLPSSEFSDYAASFSSPPTSKDCIVSVLCQNNTSDMELYLLRRGGNNWTTHKHRCPHERPPKKIKCAVYCEDEFHFLDDADKLVTFSVKDFQWKIFRIISQDKPGVESIPYYMRKNSFKTKCMKQQLGLGDDVSISICGTAVLAIAHPKTERIIFGELINPPQPQESEARSLKGVWIQPRFFYVPADQSWYASS